MAATVLQDGTVPARPQVVAVEARDRNGLKAMPSLNWGISVSDPYSHWHCSSVVLRIRGTMPSLNLREMGVAAPDPQLALLFCSVADPYWYGSGLHL